MAAKKKLVRAKDAQVIRGSYSRRRTEIGRDEMRAKARLNQIDAHEQKAFMETVRACERFSETRGLASKDLTNDFRKVEIRIVNLKEKPQESPKWTKREQDPPPTKSLKAAQMREIVMAARRAGLITDGYQADAPMPMIEWGDEG